MSSQKIKDAFDSVTPDETAKTRMYQNILKKAEKKKTPVRFAQYALPAAACLCLLVGGIWHFLPGQEEEPMEGGGVQMANPIVEVENAEEFNSIGIEMDAPEGAENCDYLVIDGEIACVEFDWDSHHYTLRASKESGDISGLYGTQGEEQTVDEEHGAVLSSVDIGTALCYRICWMDGGVNFVLFNMDGADSEELIQLYEEIIANQS